jgi:hypothetical protein
MEIDSNALITCDVAKDGGAISLGFVDTSGNPATIRLPLNQASALAMTLPGLIDQALQTRLGDQSLRHAHPLASWVLEQSSDPTKTWSRCARWTDLASAFPSHAGSKLNSARRW